MRIATLLLVGVLAGCGHTGDNHGVDLPRGPVGTIEICFSLRVINPLCSAALAGESPTAIVAVDEIDTGMRDEVSVSPGNHRITILTTKGTTERKAFKRETFSLDVREGHRYEIHTKLKSVGHHWVWVIDMTSGNIVAGESPEG